MDSKPDQLPHEESRKPRAQLSCVQCRQKKLKCDRGHACDQCTKRSQEHLCHYVIHLPRSRTTQSLQIGGPSDIRSRIRYLENLVLSLKRDNPGNRKKETVNLADPYSATSYDFGTQLTLTDPPEEVEKQEQYEAGSPGTMIVDQAGIRWVDATHWQAILDGITELKECTETLEQIGGKTVADTVADGSQAPTIFSGVFPIATKSEMLAFLPARAIVDRLVSRFLNAKEPGLVILHVPTFYKEYALFWDNQQDASLTWISLLFSILCFSAIFHYRVGDVMPGSLGEPMLVSKAFRTKAAHCLALADYTKPGWYKVEALVLYFGTEFMKSSDTQLGVSMLLGIVVRLAMHMGYHRDSNHYPSVSIFEGEMKRRVWSLISQMDHLVSFQAGLPRIIPQLQCDTGLPHNLFDEDFDKTTKLLPSSRPSTERTPVSYTIMKSKLMSIFGRITEKTYLTRSEEHEVALLDKCLLETHASMPPFLRIRTMGLSIADPPDLIMQRYTLELLYQKARCVLHRKYLTLHRSNMRFAYSRWACVDAALQILRHQNDIYHETLPGGQLYRDRWFVSSLTTHDFLLAAMILCLELSCKVDNGQYALHSEPTNSVIQDRGKLLESLDVSHRIWLAFSERSQEARKASKALAVMLHNAKRSNQGIENVVGDEQPQAHNIGFGVRPEPALESYKPTDAAPTEIFAKQLENHMNNPNIIEDPTLREIDEAMNTSEMFDWDAWDNQIQYNNGEGLSSWTDTLMVANSGHYWFSPTD